MREAGTATLRAQNADIRARKAEAERDTLREALQDASQWLLKPSDTFPQHYERLGQVREAVRAALAQGAGDESAPHPDWRNGAGIVDDT